jgi:Fe-S oxidoreductase
VAEAEARETVAPQRLVSFAHWLREDRIAPESVGDLPFHCTHCGACAEVCRFGQDVPRLLTRARLRVVESSAAPAGVREVTGRFAVAGNPVGRSLDEPLQRVAEAAGRSVDRRRAAVYHPGCVALSREPDVAVDFLRATVLLGGGDVGLTSASGACCGLPLYWAGELEGFAAHARHFAARVEGAETLVVHDPACAHALRERYPEVGVSVAAEVVSVGTWLARALASGRSRPGSSNVAYHDACQLARRPEERDRARSVVSFLAGKERVHLRGVVGGASDCCGAAGLLPEVAPAAARAMGESVIDAAKAEGAASLVTFSPRCAHHLRSVDPGFHVCDPSRLLVRM